MSTEFRYDNEYDESKDERPSELENAFLTIVLFGGLVVFGLGCMLFLW